MMPHDGRRRFAHVTSSRRRRRRSKTAIVALRLGWNTFIQTIQIVYVVIEIERCLPVACGAANVRRMVRRPRYGTTQASGAADGPQQHRTGYNKPTCPPRQLDAVFERIHNVLV